MLAALVATNESFSQVPPTPVVMKPAATTTLIENVDAVGFVHANREAEIHAQASDRIVEIRVEDGARVKKGAVLFRLDDTVEHARLEAAKLQHEAAKEALDRLQQLIRRNVAAPAKLADTKADVVDAMVELESAELAFEHTRVRAPFDGVLGALEVEEGDHASTDAPLTKIYALEPLEVWFQVPQRQLGRLAKGQTVAVWSSAHPDHRHIGRISFVSPAVDPLTKTVEVRATLDPTEDLHPGMFVSISVILQTINDAVTVPDEALVPTAKGFVVFQVKDGKAAATAVTIGLRDGNQVQITKGVAAGDQIVVEGQLKLRDGAPVVAAGQSADGKGGSK